MQISDIEFLIENNIEYKNEFNSIFKECHKKHLYKVENNGDAYELTLELHFLCSSLHVEPLVIKIEGSEFSFDLIYVNAEDGNLVCRYSTSIPKGIMKSLVEKFNKRI